MEPALLYGSSIILITLFFIILYIPIILILFIDNEFRRSPAYIIMTHIAIIDAAQLVIHFYSGVLVALQTQPIYWLDKFLGAVLTGLWFCMLFFTLFLNYNRLSTIMLSRYEWLNTKHSVIVLYTICYLSFLIPFGMKLFPDNNYLFNVQKLSWGPPDPDGPISKTQQAISKYLILVVVISSLLTYSSIFLYIGLASNAKLTKRELKITIQISLVVAYFLFSFFYWNYLYLIITMEGMFWNYLSMMVWVVMNGIHAIIYLIFNERLRKSFYRLMCKGKLPDATSQNIVLVTKMVSKASRVRTTTET